MHARPFFPGDRTREHTYPDDPRVTDDDEEGDRKDGSTKTGITSVFYDSNERLSVRL